MLLLLWLMNDRGIDVDRSDGDGGGGCGMLLLDVLTVVVDDDKPKKHP